MTWLFRTLFCILPILAIAEEEMLFSSDHINYKGKVVLLDGHVTLKHPLGILTAMHAEIEKKEGKELPQFEHIFLEKGVSLLLNNRSSIHSEEAHIDGGNFSLSLTSPDNLVWLTDANQKIALSTKQLLASFDESDNFTIKSIEAKDPVKLVFNNTVTLEGSNAFIYSSKNDPPLIEMHAKNTPCTLTTQGTLVHASEVILDTSLEKLHLHDPYGSFTYSEGPSANVHLLFSAQDLVWHDHLLTLEHNVSLEGELFGHLLVEDILEIKTSDRDAFDSMIAYGPSYFEKEDAFSLFCDGTLKLNPKDDILVATSKQDPLSFQSDKIKVFAKTASLTYKDKKPHMLHFSENVTLLSDSITVHGEDLIYNLLENHIELLGKGSEPIVFQNKENTLNMTAKALIIEKDPVTAKPVIKGVGRVHLTLNSDDENPLPILDQCIKSLF